MVPVDRRALAALSALLVTSATAPARANGRYPQAGQLVASPSDPQHVVARATFGLLDSRDGGRTWGWVCEQSVGFQGVEDPPIGVTSTDLLLAGLSSGLATSADRACDFARPGEALGKQRVIDLAVQSGATSHAVVATARFTPSKAFVVWTTDDAGATWTESGTLPAAVTYLATIDVAPSDPKRLYASGSAGSPVDGVLLRSDDGGATWTTTPLGTGADVPWIAAVDPKTPDRLFLRVNGATNDTLFRSDDGGATRSKLADVEGRLLGVALSPDGTQLAWGGVGTSAPIGLHVGPAGGATFAQANAVEPTCLAWTSAGLWACADEPKAGFTIGLSADGGSTFAPALQRASLDVLACASGTTTAALCPTAWPTVAAQLGIDAGADASADAGADAASDAGGGDTDAAASDAGRADATQDAGPGSSGGCGVAPGTRGAGGLAVIGLAAALVARRVRRRA